MSESPTTESVPPAVTATVTLPIDHLAPVDVFVVAFPSRTFHVPDFGRLLELVSNGTIVLLDVEFVEADATGVQRVGAAELSRSVDGDLTIWEGASTGLLDDDDLRVLGMELEPGNVAIVVVYENVWLLDVVAEWSADSGRLVMDGGIPPDELVAALDAAEATPVTPNDEES